MHQDLHFTLRWPKVYPSLCLRHLTVFIAYLPYVRLDIVPDNWQELIHKIKSKGMHPGVALKPNTPVEEVYPLV